MDNFWFILVIVILYTEFRQKFEENRIAKKFEEIEKKIDYNNKLVYEKFARNEELTERRIAGVVKQVEGVDKRLDEKIEHRFTLLERSINR